MAASGGSSNLARAIEHAVNPRGASGRRGEWCRSGGQARLALGDRRVCRGERLLALLGADVDAFGADERGIVSIVVLDGIFAVLFFRLGI